jgi:hypothetical protein
LKTKYVLCLLPAYVLYTLLGLRAISRLSPIATRVLIGALAVLLIAAHLYLLNFAYA